MNKIKRYTMEAMEEDCHITNFPWVKEIEDEKGEWVKYEDVIILLKDLISSDPTNNKHD
jgi:hypothetical protein